MKARIEEPLLVARAQAGDRDAFENLFLSLHPALLGYVAGIVGQEQAEDVLQETFLQIYRKIRWLHEVQAFRAWAYRIATRLAFAHLKRERRWSEQVRDEDLLDTLPDRESMARNYHPEDIERLVEQASPSSRAVLLLHFREELSLEEIALILDIPIGTAKSRLAYGLSSLRRSAQLKGTSQ